MKRLILILLSIGIYTYSQAAVETAKPNAKSDDWGAANANSTTFGGAWLSAPDSTGQPFGIGKTGSFFYAYAVRFPSIDIPQGSTIDSAELWVKSGVGTCASSLCDTAHVKLRAAIYDADDGVQIIDTGGFRLRFASRATANGTIDTADLQSTDWNLGTYYRMPFNQLDSVIQNNISRAGWTSGNSITLFVVASANCPDSSRTVRNYDYPTAGTSYDSLWISYSAAAGGGGGATPNTVVRDAIIRTSQVRAPERMFYRPKENWKW